MKELKPFWCEFCWDYHETMDCPHPGKKDFDKLLGQSEAKTLWLESEIARYKDLYEQREEQLECAHKRIRDIKKCQRYNINKQGELVPFRFGKIISHEDMVSAAALPHEDDDK